MGGRFNKIREGEGEEKKGEKKQKIVLDSGSPSRDEHVTNKRKEIEAKKEGVSKSNAERRKRSQSSGWADSAEKDQGWAVGAVLGAEEKDLTNPTQGRDTGGEPNAQTGTFLPEIKYGENWFW